MTTYRREVQALVQAIGPLMVLSAFLRSPRATEFIQDFRALTDDRCPGCGYRWATGRHQAPWVGHA